MPFAANDFSSNSSNSSTPSFTHPTPLSSIDINNIHSLQDNSFDKNLKRKRSSSYHPHPSPDYPTPSPPDSFEAIIKTEAQEQDQEKGLYRKQEQDPKQKSQDCPPRILTLPQDTNTILLPQHSSSLLPEISLSNSDSQIEALCPTSSQLKDQGTQTDFELPLTERYLNWSGRGRSPFKTPAIAAIDDLKRGAKYIEWLEREIITERKELEKIIQLRIHSVVALRRTRIEVMEDRTHPLNTVQILAHANVDEYLGKSGSPSKLIAKMRESTPPVYYENLEFYQQALPEQMKKFLGAIEEKLGEGSIPSKYEVCQTMTLQDKTVADHRYRLRLLNSTPTHCATLLALPSVT